MKRCFSSLVAVTVVLAACAGRRTTPRIDPDDQADYRIEVRNQNFNGVNVYLYSDGFKNRLGTVTGNQTRTFPFDWLYPEVRILFDFVGGGCVRTESMAVVRGDDLLLIIGANDHRNSSRALC